MRLRLRRSRELRKRDLNRPGPSRRRPYRCGRPDPDSHRPLLDPYGRGRQHNRRRDRGRKRRRGGRPLHLIESVCDRLYDLGSRGDCIYNALSYNWGDAYDVKELRVLWTVKSPIKQPMALDALRARFVPLTSRACLLLSLHKLMCLVRLGSLTESRMMIRRLDS